MPEEREREKEKKREGGRAKEGGARDNMMDEEKLRVGSCLKHHWISFSCCRGSGLGDAPPLTYIHTLRRSG